MVSCLYLQNDTTADGTAITLVAWPTVAASDTITLNGGTTSGGVSIGDYLEY